MLPPMLSPIRLSCVLVSACLSAGCASSPGEAGAPSARAAVPAGAYAQAFDGAKSTLRDLGFLLERVDAQSGVITTKPLGSAGIATPWNQSETDLDQEFEDLAQRQQRIARVEFVPAGTPPDAAPPDDLRELSGPAQARVTVSVQRVYASGLRINTNDIGRSTYTVDTDLESRGMINYAVAVKDDTRLAERIARSIAGSLTPHP